MYHILIFRVSPVYTGHLHVDAALPYNVETIPVILVSILRLVNGLRSHWGLGQDPGPLLVGSCLEGIAVPKSVSMWRWGRARLQTTLSMPHSSKGAIQESSQVRVYASTYMKHVIPTEGFVFGWLKTGVKPFTMVRIRPPAFAWEDVQKADRGWMMKLWWINKLKYSWSFNCFNIYVLFLPTYPHFQPFLKSDGILSPFSNLSVWVMAFIGSKCLFLIY